MRNDMYNDYSDKTIPYDYPHQFNGGNFSYLGKGCKPKYIWDYEDTLTISMILANEVSDVSLLSGKNAIITFYNQLGHDVYTYTIDLDTINSQNKEVQIRIDKALSKNTFVKGYYTYRVQIEDNDAVIEDNDVTTIVPVGRDTILVK